MVQAGKSRRRLSRDIPKGVSFLLTLIHPEEQSPRTGVATKDLD